MIRVTQNGEIYEITFKYDPMLVSLIKNVPGKRWVPAAKMWTIPKDKLGWFINEIRGTRYENMLHLDSDEDININASLDATLTIPEIDISSVPFYVKEGATPYQHQLDFMKYAIDRQNCGRTSGFILGDQQGLAKTCESMNLAIYNREHHNFKHCLVICCINSSKYNWQKDILAHTRGAENPYILGTRLKKDGVSLKSHTGNKEKLEDLRSGHMYGKADAPELPYFIITNIEAFRAREGKHHPFTEELIKMVNSGELNMIIIDEIHKNASPSSIQGKQLLELKKFTGSKLQWIPMTGTPITNRPTDVYLPLKLVDGHNYDSYYFWCQQFCVYGGYGGHDIIAYKNIPMLKSKLQSNMLRRLKKDVLDLPPKIYYTEYVDNTPHQERLYEQLSAELAEKREHVVESLNPMTQFLRLRQVNGSPELVDDTIQIDDHYLSKNAKLSKLLELLDDAVSRGEKTLVFSNWVEPLRTLYIFVSKKYKTCCFTGTMSEADREKHKHVFMTNPDYKVMLGTIGAMGTTHTLTAATNVIFYDEPWTPSDKEQAEDRAHRIGATEPINIITIISRDTVDDRVHDILYSKQRISSYIVDNKLDIRKNPQLFDLLLGDSRYLHK